MLDTVEDLLEGWIEETRDARVSKIHRVVGVARELISGAVDAQDDARLDKGEHFESFVRDVNTIKAESERVRDLVQEHLSNLEPVRAQDAEVLDRSADIIEQALLRAIGALHRVYEASTLPMEQRDAALSALSRVQGRLHLTQIREAAEEAEAAKGQTLEARNAAQQAAGRTGDLALGAHFSKLANREAATANLLRLSTVAILLVLVGLTSVLLSRSPASTDTVAELARASIAIPLAVLAAYLGRESARHRAAADWARQLEVQLETFEAFIAPLQEDRRQQLRSEFGKVVFSRNVSQENSQTPSTLNESIGLIERATQTLRGSTRQP